ncbi:D-glycero-D-manno-heptose 1/7-bisphosphate phosphatase [Synechococcus sp. A15-127]|nr:D-glycero-D-manno-heptose 1/7-bisphosphate phosphatase [Synechococcus sp. A15-127]
MREDIQKYRLFVSPFCQRTPALFLDRDGVVIEDCHHLSDPDHVRLCPGSRQLIASADSHGWPVVLITNQSGIARGFFEWNHVERVNQRMQELLGLDAPLAAIYANGHGPDAPAGSWRKPSPQMLLEAATALNLDLGRSMLIGDRLSDLQAGAAADLAILFHVLSGHGRNARASVVQWYEQGRQAGDTSTASGLQLLDSLEEFPLLLLKQGTPAPR